MKRRPSMKKQSGILAILIFSALLLTGCISTEIPADTSAGMTGMQQRALTVRNIGEELGATYNDVWYGVIATLQLNGFILKQADKESGYLYGVWQNTYERHVETTRGGFSLVQLAVPPGVSFGEFFSSTEQFRQIDVSVTLEPLAKTQTLVRIVARFDREGVPMAEGVFANRFFGLLRKEIFLRKNNGAIYNTFGTEKSTAAPTHATAAKTKK